MPINASGTISMAGSTTGQSVNLEVENPTLAMTSMNSPFFRSLAGIASGQIGMNNMYSKTYATSGTLWTWGSNANGRLGTNDRIHRSTPTQITVGGTNWRQVSCNNAMAAIKTDGTLWLWGTNSSGQLGTTGYVHRSTPVQTISSGTNWRQVSCGGVSTAAIKTDGTLWAWGNGIQGQLGNNAASIIVTPVQVFGGGTNWRQVSCGNFYTAATKTDGTLWLWGANSFGQLGLNNTINRSTPVQTIIGGTNWRQVSCGEQGMSAVKTDGTLWACGYNSLGQLGNNTTNVSVSTPVQVFGSGTNWHSTTASYYNTSAIKTDGTLWTWGRNGSGPCGTGDQINRSTPVQTIFSETIWRQSTLGLDHAAAIKTDGTLWSWGYNINGQIGNNTRTTLLTPIQTIFSGTNWRLVNYRDNVSAAIRS